MHNQIDVGRTSNIEIKIPVGIGASIKTELARPPRGDYERVILCLVSQSLAESKDSIIIHSIHPVPDNAYIATDEGTSWDQRFTAEIVSKGMKQNLGLLTLHEHGFSANPKLSCTDRASFEQVLQRLKILLPKRPHGSAVLGKDNSVGGLVWLPKKDIAKTKLFEITSATWLGSPLFTWPPKKDMEIPDRQMFERQITLLGDLGQNALYRTKVGILGLGGGGSHVVQQLAHAGFGNLILVDPDIVEDTNRHRMIGSLEKDVGKTSKTEVMGRLIGSINKHAKVRKLREEFPTDQTIEALKESDVIFSCVDTFKSRVPIIDFAWRHAIPLIDIGIGSQKTNTDSLAKLEMMNGHVHVYIPGGPCMWCSGFLTKEKLDIESKGKGPEYVEGVPSPAQIVSANGVVASLAVTEAMQLVTGFMIRPADQKYFRLYDAVNARLYTQEINLNPDCTHCASSLGLGDPSW